MFNLPVSSYTGYSKEFAEALGVMQENLQGAKKDALNPHHKSKYADLESCWEACGEALKKAKLVVLQWPTVTDVGYVELYTELVLTTTGESHGSSYKVPLRNATDAQALGSSITYARRYALCSILGICPEDDDGNGAVAARKGGNNSMPYVRKEQEKVTTEAVAGYRARFSSLSSVDERKALFSEVKNSTLAEPEKTEILNYMSVEIKKALKKV